MNLDKHINYWKDSAREDLEVSREIFQKKRYKHSLFFYHLFIEKIMKAHVVLTTNDMPPKTHNLIRLIELSGLKPDEKMIKWLPEINDFVVSMRYPDVYPESTKELSENYAELWRDRCEELFQWLTRKF